MLDFCLPSSYNQKVTDWIIIEKVYNGILSLLQSDCVMAVLLITIEVIIILILFLLFRKTNYFSIAVIENAFRVHLVFILLVFSPLLFLFTLYIGELGRVPLIIDVLISIRDTSGMRKLLMISTHVFLLTALLIIPLTTVFHLRYGYPRFLRYLGKQKWENNNDIIVHLKSIIKKVMKDTGIKTEPTLVPVRNNAVAGIPGFSGCGIIGKDISNLTILVAEDFAGLVQKGVLSDQETEAVFLHEISHIFHKDYFLPLWARNLVPSSTFTFATAFCFLAVFSGILLRKSLSMADIYLLIFVLFGVYLFRAIVVQLTAHILRQREHLADIRTAYLYGRSGELIEALKKMYLYIVPASNNPRVSQFMDRFTTYGEEEYIEIAHNLKEALLGLKQRFLDFALVNVHWYSKVSSRIRVIKEKRNVTADTGGFLSPFSMIGLSFLGASCFFVITASFSFLGIDLNVRKDISIYLCYTIGTVLVFMNCLPLKLAQIEVFRKAFSPPSWKQGFLHFFASRFWGIMHINNIYLFAASLICLPFNDVYITFYDGFMLFLYYTMLSLLFVTIMYIRKRKEKNGSFVFC